MKYSEDTNVLWNDLYKGRPNIRVTVGILKEDQMLVEARDAEQKSLAVNLRYDIGSLSKLFTASLLAKKVQEGRLELEEPLDRYVKELPCRYYPSLRQLATHVSGYPSQNPFTRWEMIKTLLTIGSADGFLHKNPFHGRMDAEEMYVLLRKQEIRQGDHKYAYNNFAYGVLGFILGQEYGMSYMEAMNRYVREDLKLEETLIGAADVITGHDKKNRPTGNWKWSERDLVAAAGGIASKAEDLLKFARYHLEDEKPYLQICHEKHGEGNKDWEMGLGWRLDREEPVHWHDGNAGGHSCFLGVNVEKKTAAVVLTNYGLLNLKKLGFSLIRDVS